MATRSHSSPLDGIGLPESNNKNNKGEDNSSRRSSMNPLKLITGAIEKTGTWVSSAVPTTRKGQLKSYDSEESLLSRLEARADSRNLSGEILYGKQRNYDPQTLLSSLRNETFKQNQPFNGQPLESIYKSKSVNNTADTDGHPERRPLLSDKARIRTTKDLTRADDNSDKKEDCFNPLKIFFSCFRLLLQPILLIAISCFVLAYILFYYCGNPEWDLLPVPHVSLSWWLNFIGRQLLLLELSRFSQFVLIDVLVQKTRFGKRILGSWIRFVFVQAKGFPFVLTIWGILADILLHGKNHFELNWLYWTHLSIYSKINPGYDILYSDFYERIICCMIVSGIAMIIKKVWVKLFFGRRDVAAYKIQLEGLLNEMILLSDIGDLAMKAEEIMSPDRPDGATATTKTAKSQQKKQSEMHLKSLQFDDDPAMGSSKNVDDEPGREMKTSENLPSIGMAMRQPSDDMTIKDKLDRWDEPDDRLNQTEAISMDDIIKFNQILARLRLDFPFSENFGRAGNRDELIGSAQTTYKRLMKLAPGSDLLPFSLLESVTRGDNGIVNPEKRALLKYLFRGDASGNLQMISFVQSCDWVYRQLRYFRASVGNARVIDKQATIIINGIFGFVLFLIILSMLKYNPWTLLVSVSTLLVTASFAVGPTCAKGIEGVLLICARRPFDIGDRIVIANTAGDLNIDSIQRSWFVENITLFSTTLRFAATGEIAIVGNGNLSDARITNLNRTRLSVVIIELLFDISLHDKDNLRTYKEKLDDYISSNPNIWDGINYFQCEDIDTNNHMVKYKLAVRCRVSWQNAKRVYGHRSDLQRYCTELATKLGVVYTSKPTPGT